MDYPGLLQPPSSCQCGSPQCHQKPAEPILHAIVRHYRTPWATPDMRRKWREDAVEKLRTTVAEAITWQLDENMFKEKRWLGYTCRHVRGPKIPLSEVDSPYIIEQYDGTCRYEGQTQRRLSLLLSAEYAHKLRSLLRRGGECLVTAFNATVTILHELANAIFWKDLRTRPSKMGELFYGADLELELGNSFIAHCFGGWVPVPVVMKAERHQ